MIFASISVQAALLSRNQDPCFERQRATICRITRITSSILLTRTDMDLGMCTGDRNMKYSVFVQRGGMSPPALGAEEEDIQHKAVPSRPLRSIYSLHPGGTVVDLFDSAPLRPDSSCLTLTPCGGT